MNITIKISTILFTLFTSTIFSQTNINWSELIINQDTTSLNPYKDCHLDYIITFDDDTIYITKSKIFEHTEFFCKINKKAYTIEPFQIKKMTIRNIEYITGMVEKFSITKEKCFQWLYFVEEKNDGEIEYMAKTTSVTSRQSFGETNSIVRFIIKHYLIIPNTYPIIFEEIKED